MGQKSHRLLCAFSRAGRERIPGFFIGDFAAGHAHGVTVGVDVTGKAADRTFVGGRRFQFYKVFQQLDHFRLFAVKKLHGRMPQCFVFHHFRCFWKKKWSE